jgi:prevent-host-death family protein
MSTVGVKELKNRLSHYLRLAKQGGEVVVTDRGKPVALMQSMRSAQEVKSLEARLGRLAAEQRVTLPSRKPVKGIRPVRVRGTPISQYIIDDRQ